MFVSVKAKVTIVGCLEKWAEIREYMSGNF